MSSSPFSETSSRQYRMLVHVPVEGSMFLLPSKELELDLMTEVYEIQVSKKLTQVKRRYWGEIPDEYKRSKFNFFKRKFVWMNYENEGIIEIGKQGNAVPYYIYTDPNPDPIEIKFLRGVKSVQIYRLPKLHRSVNLNKDLLKNMRACLADSESGRDTSKVGVGPSGSQKFGVFQIDSLNYCQKGRKGGLCNAKCEDFLQDDITESAQCAKIIFQRDGFKYWNKWVKSCKTRDLTNFLTHCPPVARSILDML